jgi:hypothetical protein
MIEVRIENMDPNKILDIVKSLRTSGLVQGIDFDFSYRQSKWDNFGYDAVVKQHTLFTFYVDKHATMFILKYVT